MAYACIHYCPTNSSRTVVCCNLTGSSYSISLITTGEEGAEPSTAALWPYLERGCLERLSVFFLASGSIFALSPYTRTLTDGYYSKRKTRAIEKMSSRLFLSSLFSEALKLSVGKLVGKLATLLPSEQVCRNFSVLK